jgi:phosphoribosylformylglycinamidine (FGAM) synthase-like enzyme
VPGAWREGDLVLLAGGDAVALDGSEYQAQFLGGPAGRPPPPDYLAEAALIHFLWRSAPGLSAAHDLSDGGLAVALAELALHSGIGAELELDDDVLAWFGEGCGRAIVACAPERAESLEGMPLRRLGVVGGDRLLGIRLAELRAAFERGGS